MRLQEILDTWFVARQTQLSKEFWKTVKRWLHVIPLFSS